MTIHVCTRALYISSVLKEEVEDKMLECQTEEDRYQKLNHHTAGIISCINWIATAFIVVLFRIASWHLAMWDDNHGCMSAMMMAAICVDLHSNHIERMSHLHHKNLHR